MSKVTNPVLTIHGRKDRNAPYGAGREWAWMLPESRLLTIDEGAHAPWIEAPAKMFGAIREFFDGRWPVGAEKVLSV
jgi:pimeloyl-ACP methyl ester carboxylesterase